MPVLVPTLLFRFPSMYRHVPLWLDQSAAKLVDLVQPVISPTNDNFFGSTFDTFIIFHLDLGKNFKPQGTGQEIVCENLTIFLCNAFLPVPLKWYVIFFVAKWFNIMAANFVQVTTRLTDQALT